MTDHQQPTTHYRKLAMTSRDVMASHERWAMGSLPFAVSSVALPPVHRRRSAFPLPDRPCRKLRPRREPELPQRARDVPLDGAFPDPELASNQAIRLSLRNQFGHVALALREPA